MSEDQREPLDFIDFSHMTTAEGNVREDEPPEEQRSPTDARAERWKDAEVLHEWRTPEAEQALLRRDGRLYHRATFPAQTVEPTHVHAVVDVILAEEVLRLRSALAEKEARIETLRLSLDVIVERFAGLGLRAEDADEASLMAADRIREKEAALAANESAMAEATLLIERCAERAENDAKAGRPHDAADALWVLHSELLADGPWPRLARLDRLRREVVDAVEAVELAEDFYMAACGAMGQQSGGSRARALARRMNDARERRDAALAALRAEEEKNA